MPRGRMTNIELKELIEVHMNSIRQEIKSTKDLMDYKFEEQKKINAKDHNEIITHQKITNGRVNALERKSQVLGWIARNPKITILSVIVGWFILHSLSETFTLETIIKIFK